MSSTYRTKWESRFNGASMVKSTKITHLEIEALQKVSYRWVGMEIKDVSESIGILQFNPNLDVLLAVLSERNTC